MASFAVITCSDCQEPWLVELRHNKATCHKCNRQYLLRRRTRLWEGDDQNAGRAALQSIKAQGHFWVPEPKEPRHDSFLDEAASHGRSEVNKSKRAEATATALFVHANPCTHEELQSAFRKAGIPTERAEKEAIRLLVADFMYEPKPGYYAPL